MRYVSMSMKDFWDAQAEWSRETFGPDSHRGPKGPLKHLVKEVQRELLGRDGNLNDLEEYADLQFLVFDAARRAGFTYEELLRGCFDKLAKNKARQWPDWRTAPVEDPVEHVRE